jgi:hypothetical protein
MIPIAGGPSGVATALAWGQEAQETSPEAGQAGARAIPVKSQAAAPFAGGAHALMATRPWKTGAGPGIGKRPLALRNGVVQKGATGPAPPPAPRPRRGVSGDLPGGKKGSAGP